MPNKKRASRKPKKRRHVCGVNGLCIHGAFTTRARAEAKRDKLGKKALVIKKFALWGNGERGYRYMVCTSDKSGVPF
jgi:hypothetical protein